MITFFLPARSLSLNFPPCVLASSKSGAFWPTSRADATPASASSQILRTIAWMVFAFFMNAPFRVDEPQPKGRSATADKQLRAAKNSARVDTLAQRRAGAPGAGRVGDGLHGGRALTSGSVPLGILHRLQDP